MGAIAVHACGFASTFRLKELTGVFGGAAVRAEKERLIATFAEGRFALAYDFGAVVFFGVEATERERVVSEIVKRFSPEPHPPLTEDFVVEVTGTPERAPEVHFDRVVVSELTAPIADIVGLVIAQSVAMDYYSEDVEQILSRTNRITSELQVAGRIHGPVKALLKFIGACMETRNGVLSTLALFDKPDATWENEQLDRLWNGLYRMLELDDRYRSLEAKLRMIQDNLVVLVDLSRQRQTMVLEVTVAVLILFEMLVMIWQVVQK